MKYKMINNVGEITLAQETSEDALVIGRLSAKLENGYGRTLRPSINKEGGVHILTCCLQDIVNLACK